MKILLVHNFYQQKGGEDAVFQLERDLLVENGHSVQEFTVHNEIISGVLDKIKVFVNLNFSKQMYKKLKKKILEFNPDIVHVHNFFPLLTPSIFFACQEMKTPVVMTLHNYRLICPSATLMVDGKIYEKSINGSAYWTFFKKVYKKSYLGTLALSYMVEKHKKKGTWNSKIDKFICLTQFAKSKFIEAGFLEDNIDVKPNFIKDPLLGNETKLFSNRARCALFVGRFSKEKGIQTLFESWRKLNDSLWIAGDGPLYKSLAASKPTRIELLGWLERKELNERLARAQFLVFPSECYEGFPMTILEAYAHGLPVLASRLGSMAEVVKDGYTGLQFGPGDASDLAEKAKWLFQHPEECIKMGQNARMEFKEKYSAVDNYRQLKNIYLKVNRANLLQE